MTKIRVKRLRENRYEVVIEDKFTNTNHIVEMSDEYYKSLDTDSSPEEVVRRSIDFLLDKEPKEAILQRFNIEIIESFFPDFSKAVKNF